MGVRRHYNERELRKAYAAGDDDYKQFKCFEWDNRITPFDQSATEMELADVLICCLSMANALGVDAMKIVERKLAINAAKYPIVDSSNQQKP